ncbi:MAG TPA: hypothetical protein VGM19_04825 [Armatimonadota bacterium]|jgi:hypothetical protein
MKRLLGLGLILMLLVGASLVAAAETAAPSVDVLILGYARAITPKYVQDLAAQNVHLYWVDADRNAGDPAFYPPEFLKKFQVIIVVGTLEQALPSTIVGELKPGILRALDEYYKAGGSILWVPLGEGRGGTTWAERIGSRYDVTSYEEALVDPGKVTQVSVSAVTRNLATYLWTSDITKHPVTEGVSGLFLPKWGEWSWPGTVPMKYGKSWQVLVRGMDTTRTIVNDTPLGSGQEVFTYGEKTGVYAASPEVVGVREAQGASGRMMVFPLYITWTWGNYGHIGLRDALMLNGDGTHPSDGFRLLLNAYRWLAEPARAAGLGGFVAPPAGSGKPDLSPYNWSTASYTENRPEWKGLIGARTAAGGGSGTVAQWVTAAKAAGLSYIAFLEDPAKLTEASLAQEVADCKAQTTDTFAAIPGFGYYDVRGIYRYNLGVWVLPVKDNFAPDGRLKDPTGVVYQHQWRVGTGFGGLQKATLDPWWNYVTFGCAVKMYEGPKLVDDGFARYLNMEAGSLTLNPITVVSVDRPADLAAAAAAAQLPVVRGATPLSLIDATRGGSVQPSDLYLTSGPKISRWWAIACNGMPYRPGANQFRLLLDASSDAGLKEITIFNAQDGSVYRRYDCAGAKTYSVSVDENHSQQWYLCPVVTDLAGKTAMGACLATYTDGARLWAMGDRLMGMNHVTSWDEKKETLKTFGNGIEITFHKGIPEGGEEPSSSRRGELKIQGIDGGDIYTAACKVRLRLTTSLGTEPTESAFRYTPRLASFDGDIIDYVGDQQFAAGDPFLFNGPPRQTLPTKLADITSRLISPRGRYHQAVSAVVYEVTTTFKQAQQFRRLNLATMNFGETPHEYDQLFIRDKTGPALSWLFQVGDKFSRLGQLPVGGYVYPDNVLGGAPGVIALSDNLSYESGQRWNQIYLDGRNQEVKPGDKVTARFLVFMRPFEDQTNNAWLEKFIADYGIGCPPSYKYEVTQGKLRGINYFLDVDAADGGAVVAISKYDLPHDLSVRVFGVPASNLTGQYDLVTKQVRMLPVAEGAAWTMVETNARDHRLYIGELLRCDNPAARVSLAPNGVNWFLEVNNPTDKPITCNLTGVPAFAPLSGTKLTVTLAPGASEKRALPSAPGTVVQAPWMES